MLRAHGASSQDEERALHYMRCRNNGQELALHEMQEQWARTTFVDVEVV